MTAIARRAPAAPRAGLLARAGGGAVRLLRDPGLRLALLCTLLLRLATQAAVVAGELVEGVGRIHGDHLEVMQPRAGGTWWLAGPWERWDALWFVHLASAGYTHGSPDVAFFPAYPLSLHLLAPLLGGSLWAAALTVPTVAFTAGLAVVHRLVRSVLDERVATRTVVILCILPASFFYVAPYSESLFLLLSGATLLALVRRRLLVAGMLAAAGALTRPQGGLLAVPVAVESLLLVRAALHTDGLRSRLTAAVAARAGAATAAPLVATGAWWWASRTVYGYPGGFTAAENAKWRATVAPPWSTLPQSIRIATDPVHHIEWLNLACLLVTVVLVGAAVWWRTLPWSWVAYAAVTPLPSLFRGDGGTPLQSLSRYLVVCIPLAVVLARPRLPRAVELPLALAAGAFMLWLLNDHVHFRFVA